ncbi:unnamed protein product [Strongylus vulgaris]|uniref:G-protein coupled receptors family 1 profile domain-containing protein n=1 Tax=Strongylus vulgaris TaxID=40348 RepID=A0A3P7JG44_STRVU|nr:unnamed protein product [Strongylus vulgaris]
MLTYQYFLSLSSLFLKFSYFQWYGGELLCRLCSFFSTFSFYANSFVIACIAIDRVFGAYNMSSINAHRRAYLRCRRLLVIGWIAAFGLSVPQAMIFRVFEPYPDRDFRLAMHSIMDYIFIRENRGDEFYKLVGLRQDGEYHGLPKASAISQLDDDSSKSSAKGKRPLNLDAGPQKTSPMLRAASPGVMAVSTIHKAKQV